MRCISSCRHHVRSLTSALLLLTCAAAAQGADSYNPSNKQLTIPSIAIGSTTYSNMVVTVRNIVSGPIGTAPSGSEDS